MPDSVADSPHGVFVEVPWDEATRPLVDIFGFAPAAFERHRFWCHAISTSRWIADADCVPVDGLRYEAFGMLVLRREDAVANIGTTFIRAFGHLATRNVVDLDDEAAEAYLARETLEGVEVPTCTGGYCIVRHAGRPLGRAVWRDGSLRSELPKMWSIGRGS